MRSARPFPPRPRTFPALPRLLLVFFLLAFLPIPRPVQAAQYKIITAPEVKSMIENDPRVVVINVLSSIEYDGLHITGSINIPIIDLASSPLLPKDKSTPVVFYCMGHE